MKPEYSTEYVINRIRSNPPGQNQIFRLATMTLTLLIVAGWLTNCRSDSEVLASFDGGTITRGEFRRLFNLTRGEDAIKTAKINVQDRMLRSFAVVKIAAMAARKAGMDKNEEFKKNYPLMEERTKIESYARYLQEKSTDRPFKMLELQVLFLRKAGDDKPGKGPHGSSDAGDSRNQEAEQLLTRLNSGLSDREIMDLIAEKTELEQTRVVGGLETPICINCSTNRSVFLTKPASEATVGKFIHIPNISRGHWLVRKLGERTLKDDELEDYFVDFFKKQARLAQEYIQKHKDKKAAVARIPQDDKTIETRARQQSQFIVRNEKRNLFFFRLNHLKTQKKFVLHEAGRFMPGNKSKIKYEDSTPLFSLQGKNFTYGDLKKLLPSKDYELDRQLQMINLVVMMEILKDDPDFKKSLDSDIFKFFKSLRDNETLGMFYLMQQKSDTKIDTDRVRKLYDLQKHTLYKGKSFAQVKGQIEKQVQRSAAEAAIRGMRDKLAKEYHLKIHSESLKAGQI